MLLFSPLNFVLIEISRSLFKQSRNSSLVMFCFVFEFWVIFGYIWEEIVFLKGFVKIKILKIKLKCSFKIRIWS